MKAHHGHGRPVVKPLADEELGLVSARIDGVDVEAPASLAKIDWGQPARFSRLQNAFGPWEMAFLETVLKAADHSISKKVSENA